MEKYHYLALFLAGYLVLSPFMLHRLYIEQDKNTEAFAEQGEEEADTEPAADEAPGMSEKDALAEEKAGAAEISPFQSMEGAPGGEPGTDEVSGQKPEAEEVSGQESGTEPEGEEISGTESGSDAEGVSGQEQDTGQETGNGSGEEQKTEEETGEGQETETEEELSPETFFQDTLFIGDSRTMGLWEYADLNNAVIFANTGMNIYRLYSMKNGVKDQKTYLEDILAEKQYRRIYLMLGINELGYDEGHTIKRYEEEVLKLQALQPEAKIVLEANLHVTTARSGRDAIFNNENIDRINENIRQIAEKYGFSYINVNEIFDDETGGLNPECTHDEVHVLGKYYQQWADWIRANGI